MAETPSREVLAKVRKLAQLPQEARESTFAVSVTRLTSLKSLCQRPEVAGRFVTHLARKVLRRVEQGKGHSSRAGNATDVSHREMMAEALSQMEAWLQGQTEERRRALRELLTRMQAEQNEYRNIPWGAVRQISDWDLLLIEDALRCLLAAPGEAGRCAYQMARDYAERYDPSHGTGLIPESVPLVRDIVQFFFQEFDLDAGSLTAPARVGQAKGERQSAARSGEASPPRQKKPRFTHRQGQFLAFIHLYRKLHRRGPAEHELVSYFRVTPPSAHAMIVKLEELGLISREPGVPRSARVAVPESDIPPLQDIGGPPWPA
jgi:hypothetical protein